MPDQDTGAQNAAENPAEKPVPEKGNYPTERQKGVEFLRHRFADLHVSPEVIKAVLQAEEKTGQRVGHKPVPRIQAYLDRLQAIFGVKDEAIKKRRIDKLKQFLYGQFIVRPEEIPEAYFETQRRIAREMGHGDIEITDELKKEHARIVTNNQRLSLDKWVDYLTSPDADYPDWARYWAFRSMLEMGKFEKVEDEHGRETGRFAKRTKSTVASFPPLNPRALAMTIGVLREKLKRHGLPKGEQVEIENVSKKLSKAEFQQLMSSESFSRIYAQFLIELPEYTTEGLQEIRGKWVKYDQGSDARPLVDSFEGYPLEWCTADYDTAHTQLQGGDFYVYYSLNEAGEAVVPRLAIRMEGDKIAEPPRGIAPDQNLDPYIVPVLEAKLKEFGAEGEAYKKRAENMKRLTALESRHKRNEKLFPEDLKFLYEQEGPIEGFGYRRDPRIDEIKKGRSLREDAAIIDIFSALEKRFQSPPAHYKRPEGVEFAEVKAALKKNPEAALSLAMMELTGGAPDIVAVEGDAFVFGDCSKESPLGRRNLDFDESSAMAGKMGVQLMEEKIYRKIQDSGEFDIKSWSWLAMPDEIRKADELRKAGGALFGIRRGGGVHVDRLDAAYRFPFYGFRASLRVPRS